MSVGTIGHGASTRPQSEMRPPWPDLLRSLCARRLFDDVELNLCYTLSDDSKRLRGAMGDVAHASGNERTAVVDPDRHRLPGGDVGDAHARGERQRAMRGCQFARLGFVAICRVRRPVKAGKSVRCRLLLRLLVVG